MNAMKVESKSDSMNCAKVQDVREYHLFSNAVDLKCAVEK